MGSTSRPFSMHMARVADIIGLSSPAGSTWPWATIVIFATGAFTILRTLLPPLKLAYKMACRSGAWVLGKLTVKETSEQVFGESKNVNVGAEQDGLYGLEHVALNWSWEKGLGTMWMNMGYWKNTDSFPEACENLLVYCLEHAGLLPPNRNSSFNAVDESLKNEGTPQPKNIDILDLGFGCGDQTLLLTRSLKTLAPHITVNKYIGITLSPQQCEFARKRVLEERDVKSPPTTLGRSVTGPKILLFNEDASQPRSWPATPPSHSQPFLTPPNNKPTTHTPHEHWTIALDSLYHFRPSRLPILKFAHNSMNSNLVAFDFFRPSSPGPSSSFLASSIASLPLRTFCLLTSTPYTNLLTQEEYISMLVNDVGYAKEDIAIHDISEYVFPGLARFIGTRTGEMERMGMRWKGWAGFKFVGWVVGRGWFCGGVVVARWRQGGGRGGAEVREEEGGVGVGVGQGQARRRR
ncbi:hypothetical protein DFH27DRAFT_513596 [Peziza echinospora]|nr:hypothetical protein DFH27DRAFT_513596 [Peziza echinospora]